MLCRTWILHLLLLPLRSYDLFLSLHDPAPTPLSDDSCLAPDMRELQTDFVLSCVSKELSDVCFCRKGYSRACLVSAKPACKDMYTKKREIHIRFYRARYLYHDQQILTACVRRNFVFVLGFGGGVNLLSLIGKS